MSNSNKKGLFIGDDPVGDLHIRGKLTKPDNTLTKREKFAMAAMQGIWSSDTEFEMTPKSVAQLATESADALLNELEESQ